MSVVSEAIENMETVDMDDLAYGPFEVNTTQLAQILGVTRESVNRWAREEVIVENRLDPLTPGRPTRVFDLFDVATHLRMEEEGSTYQTYAEKVEAEISRRQGKIDREAAPPAEAPLDQAVRETREAEITERETLLSRIDTLEHLVVSLAAKMKDNEPVSAEESLEILDIVFRRYEVR